MYCVFEVFPDGKQFEIFQHEDKYECVVWAMNHQTHASRIGKSAIVVCGDFVDSEVAIEKRFPFC